MNKKLFHMKNYNKIIVKNNIIFLRQSISFRIRINYSFFELLPYFKKLLHLQNIVTCCHIYLTSITRCTYNYLR